jgi:pimeloyl-ACP methyl ester carboxylesterase
MNKTIVFVHGAWLTSLSWENFTGYFEEKGYTCIAPEWPYRDQPAAKLREHTPPELAQVGFKELTDHYDAIIRKLPEPPILIGPGQRRHRRGIGRAGRRAGGRLDGLESQLERTVQMDELGQGADHDLPRIPVRLCQRLPGSRSEEILRPLRGAGDRAHLLPGCLCSVGPAPCAAGHQRAPLLLITGELDHLVPAHVSRSNFEHYQNSSARTDFHEFPGRSHLHIAYDGWEEVADYTANWLKVIEPVAMAMH